MMKRIHIVLAIVILSGIALLLVIWPRSSQDTGTETVREVLDGYIQTSSKNKPFSYSIVSLNKAIHSFFAGEVWCSVISPPLQNDTSSITHIVTIKSPDGSWNSIFLENGERDLQNWLKTGCSKW